MLKSSSAINLATTASEIGTTTVIRWSKPYGESKGGRWCSAHRERPPPPSERRGGNCARTYEIGTSWSTCAQKRPSPSGARPAASWVSRGRLVQARDRRPLSGAGVVRSCGRKWAAKARGFGRSCSTIRHARMLFRSRRRVVQIHFLRRGEAEEGRECHSEVSLGAPWRQEQLSPKSKRGVPDVATMWRPLSSCFPKRIAPPNRKRRA